MNRFVVLLATVAIIAVGGWFALGGRDGAGTPVNPLVGAANAQDAAEVDVSSIAEMVVGNPDAAVEVVEYASFTCPHCATFHTTSFKQLKSDFIDTDKIKFTYREVYFHQFGLWASMIARCGGTTERFFGMTDLIYKSQSDWTRAGEHAAIVEELRKIGRVAGLDNDTLESCLQDGDKAKTLVAWFQQNAEADGITSTPSFIIDGKKYANMGYDDMKQIIQDAVDAQ